MLEDVVGHVDRVHEVPPGVDVDAFRPAPRDEALAGLLAEARRDPPNPGNREERLPDEGNAERLAAFFAGDEPTVLYFGKLLYNKGVHLLFEALRGLDARAVDRRLRRLPRRARGAAPPSATLFTGPARAPPPRPAAAARDVAVVPSIFPEAFGMVAAEAAAAGCPPLVARHSGLAEIADGLEEEYPPQLRDLAAFAPATRRPRGEAAAASSRSRPPSAPRSPPRPPPRRRAPLELGLRASRRSGLLATPASNVDCADGRRAAPDARRSSSRFAREQFENGTDFTLAVEEEFALLDPETLDLVNRFEDVAAAPPGTPLDEHLAGELIASEIEVQTGRCETFAEAAALLGRAPRRAARSSPTALGVALAATGTHPWSSWKDQRIIDTPHYRRVDEPCATSPGGTRPSASTCTSACAAPTAPIRVCDALRAFLPGAARAVGQLAVRRGRRHRPALGAHADLHAHVPALRHPGRVRRLGRVRALRPLPLRHRLDPGAHADLVERPARTSRSRRSRSGSATAQPDARRARGARRVPLRARRPLLRALDEGEPLPEYPHRLIEENLWRAIRYGLSGELIDLERGDVLPARARLEQLAEWVAPVAEELGAAAFLAVPAANAAERQLARVAEGWILRADLRGAGRKGGGGRG